MPPSGNQPPLWTPPPGSAPTGGRRFYRDWLFWVAGTIFALAAIGAIRSSREYYGPGSLAEEDLVPFTIDIAVGVLGGAILPGIIVGITMAVRRRRRRAG